MLCSVIMLSNTVILNTYAQDPALEEVVVTARKRSESLQEVPIAVTAFTETQIERAGIGRPEDFISLMPNVTLVNTANIGDTQVSIRGMVSTRDAESTFAYVVDGVLTTNPNSFNEELLDVRQIEVLKGPQGALYGRNAVAGAILVTTNEPDNEFKGKVKLGAGNNGSRNGTLVVSGPLIENKLAGRISLSTRETDGHFKNSFTNKDDAVDYMEDTTARGRLIWDINDDLSLDFRAGYSEAEGGAINFNAAFAIPAFAAANGPAFVADVNDHKFVFGANVPGKNEQETKDFSLKADWTGEAFDTTVIFAYNDLEEYLLSDGTSAAFFGYELTAACQADRATINSFTRPDLFGPLGAPFAVLPPPGTDFLGLYGPYTPTACDGYQYQERNQEDSSIEVRLTSPHDQTLRWIAGVYAADIEREVVVAYGADTGQGFLKQPYVDPTGPNPTDLLFHDQFDTQVYAVFGQLAFDLATDMELAFALRYDREEREVSNKVPNVSASGLNINALGAINPAFIANPTGIPDRDKTYTQVQPKITWRWEPADDINLYASWGVGFRSGGFNSIGTEALINTTYNIPAVNAQLLVKDEYDKEVTTSFEIGSKMEFWQRRLQVNVAIFQTEVEDNQFFEFFVGPFGLLRAVTTIDELEIRGFELDFTALVSENLSVFGGIGLLDSEIKENKNRPLTKGNDAPQAPEQTYNLGAQLDIPISDGIDFIARLDWQYVGETWFHTLQGEQTPTIWNALIGPFGFNQDFSTAQRDAYDTLNARLSVTAQNWDITLWGRNITDEDYLEEVIPAAEFGGSFIHPAAKESYGIDITYRF